MKSLIISAAVLMFCIVTRADTPRRASFDADWKFNLGDATGADRPDFDDAKWRTLDLPHDWMIEQPFDEKSPGGNGNGYLNGGIGWYRKSFTIPAENKGKHIAIDFDGVYMNSHVWINGHDLGVHPYGYTSFEYDLTPYLKFGDEKNKIAVRAEVVQPCSRFYSGAGIYRNVWLEITPPVHADRWGTFVTSDVKDDVATVVLHLKVVNDSGADKSYHFKTTLTGPNGETIEGQLIAQNKIIIENPGIPPTTLPAGTLVKGDPTVHLRAVGESVSPVIQFKIEHPVLWSIEKTKLYHVSTVITEGTNRDEMETSFGIRTVEFTKDDGLHLNGKRVQLQGVCDHHDLGCLGAAINTSAIQRQLEILKSFGCNAIRTSHYPPAPELLDLCDQMGFLVMDEAFDEWKDSKTKHGYGQYFDEWSERDIVSMVRRDRNHPSVIMWSIGNEIPEQGDKTNAQAMAQRLADFVRREDPTRQITSALNQPANATKNHFSKALDLFGVNYNIGYYDTPAVHGVMPMLGSETASALSSRGEYGLKLNDDGKVVIQKQFNHQVTDYELVGPAWGSTAQAALQAMKDHPWMAGEFVWTGFDYLGEPTPYAWPSRSSYFGIVDLCGFPKDRFYLYKSAWTNTPMVHVLPHWNWEEFAGKEIPVWCYSNCDSVELFLNDKSLGTKTWRDRVQMHLEWSVPYAPGTLKAVGKNDGKVIATDIIKTAGKPAKILLKADRSEIKSSDRDLSFVTVSVVDADGNVCPNAGDEIKFTIDGPGTIAGVDNGDPTNHESFQAHEHKAFHGLGLVVIAGGKQAGDVKLTASGEGLESASSVINVK